MRAKLIVEEVVRYHTLTVNGQTFAQLREIDAWNGILNLLGPGGSALVAYAKDGPFTAMFRTACPGLADEVAIIKASGAILEALNGKPAAPKAAPSPQGSTV